MTSKIVVPELGESVLEATVSRWLKKEGDFVNVGDVLVELETDKVNLEVGAKNPGVLAKIDVPEGTDVKVGDVLGTIDEKAEQPQATAPAAETPQPEKVPEAAKENQESVRTDGNSRGTQQATPQLTPVASRLARENNVDVSQLTGTGTEGRVTKSDVEQFLQEQQKTGETQKPSSAELQPESAEREKSTTETPLQPEMSTKSAMAGQRQQVRARMSRRRRTIAHRLLEATQNTAMLTTFNEIDMGAVMDLRKRRNEEFQTRHGIKLGFMSFFVKAAI